MRLLQLRRLWHRGPVIPPGERETIGQEQTAGDPANALEALLSERCSAWLDEYLEGIRAEIIKDASDTAKPSKGETIPPATVSESATKIARGRPCPELPIVPQPTKWERWGALLTNITLVSTILAIAFGLFGFTNPDPTAGAGYLDIAKIFAGAIVGSAGATAATSLRGK